MERLTRRCFLGTAMTLLALPIVESWPCDAGLSPCRYPVDELVFAGKEGGHETRAV
jgi:hypothetical protein